MVKINKRYWWLSDLDSVMKDGEFAFSKNVTTTEEKCYLWGRQEIVSSTISDTMYCWVEVYDQHYFHSKIYFLWADWAWYYYNGTKVLQMTKTKAIINAKVFGDYIYWTYWDWYNQGYIGRISTDDAYGSTDWTAESSYNETRWSIYTEYSWDNFHMEEFNWVLYVVHSKRISTIDASWTLTTDVLTYPRRIKGITSHQNRIKLFIVNWDVLLRDGISDSYESKISLPWEIFNAWWVWWLDYVLWDTAETGKVLYEVSFPQWRVLKTQKSVDRSIINKSREKFYFRSSDWDNWIGTDSRYIYFMWKIGIYKYGSDSDILPKAFTLVSTDAWDSNWNETHPSFLLVSSEGNRIYYYDLVVNKIAAVWNSLATFWEIQTRKYNYWVDKFVVNEVKLRLHVPFDTRWIQIKYRKDNSNSRSSFWDKITNQWSDITTVTVSDYVEFNNIQRWLKFTYTGSTETSDYPPTVYELEFNPINVKR